MHLAQVHVLGFRCLADVVLELGDMTALIGMNGSGKSALLRAVAAFYDEGDPPVVDDWYAANLARELEVSLTFSALSADEAEVFKRYVSPEGTLRVSRVWSVEDGRTRTALYGYHLACPEFAAVRDADKGVRDLHNMLQESGRFAALERVTRAEDSEPVLQVWEQANPDRCEWIRDSGRFFGWNQVGGGKLAQSSICVYVPAVRDARADAAEGKGSVLSRIVALVIRGELDRNPALAELREETQERFDRILQDTRPVLGDVARDLTTLMSRFSPGAEVLLDWRSSVAALPDWPSIEARLLEDGVDTPVFAKGHGLQRSFIVSLLQRLAELLSDGDAQADAPRSRHTLFLIEEPELYQHPLAARRFAAVLRQLAESEGNTQIVYSTHHRDFVSFDHFDSVRHVSKASAGQDPPATQIQSFTISEVRDDLIRLWDLDPAVVTEETTRQRLRTVMTPEVSEGFFARRVVLVEGEQDRALIEGYADILSIDLSALGVAVLPVGGKSSIDRAALVFKGFGIPPFLIWDGDATSDAHQDAVQNRVLLRLAGLDVTDFPPTTISDTAAVFNDKIEAELRAVLGEDFAAVLEEAAGQVGLARGRDLLKTAYGCTALLSLALAKGRDLGVLDQLLRRIEAWASG